MFNRQHQYKKEDKECEKIKNAYTRVCRHFPINDTYGTFPELDLSAYDNYNIHCIQLKNTITHLCEQENNKPKVHEEKKDQK
jgi:hypothetical protein